MATAADVLQALLDLVPHAQSAPPLLADIWQCPSCLAEARSLSSPYCGPHCREEAGFVRQVRRALAEGQLDDLEKRSTLGQVLWALLGGGYPARLEMVPPKVLAKVLARDDGTCQKCGARAEWVEHAKTACNRPINLHAVCEACRVTRPFLDAEMMQRETVRARLEGLVLRIAGPQPLRLCDDPVEWDWRAFVADRKAAAKADRVA